ncbi:ABC transporter ATP-binding protein [Bifidobacterium lemurum]|nr:ABC transporter ATP-binding protein [Bifidobacterium lemurum]QOL35503.1 ABC transporter ATP-binding protein [Bifidobacterium lemurum]
MQDHETPLLAIRDLTREFKRRGEAFAAVDHVDLTVDAGEFIAIVGRSGNGKSTLLNLITGLLTPTSGSVTLDGRDVASLSDREISALRNTVIGFVPQSHTLLGNLTVLDNVILPAVLGGGGKVPAGGDPSTALGMTDDGTSVASEGDSSATSSGDSSVASDDSSTTSGGGSSVIPSEVEESLAKTGDGSLVIPSEVEESPETQVDPDMPDVIAPMPAAEPNASEADPLVDRATELLTRLGVADLSACYPKELSGGEMRRVSIARALMNDPKLLIADEPTGDLDAESTAIVMRLLRETADRGTAVLMVTHDHDALAYVDRRYRMDRGILTQD